MHKIIAHIYMGQEKTPSPFADSDEISSRDKQVTYLACVKKNWNVTITSFIIEPSE